MIKLNGLFNDNDHVITDEKGIFQVIEHKRDLAVGPETAEAEFFMSRMGVRKKQILAKLNGNTGVTTQVGAMQWMAGNVYATTGLKGAGDFIGKMFKGAATGETAIKPEYKGEGYLMLEPTYKYMLLEDVADWEGGLVLDDGLFLACESTVKHKLQARSNVSSVMFGKMGLFNMKLVGKGIAVLESNVPREQLIEIELVDDVLKIDGNFAICWSGTLEFSTERSGKTLIGSAASGEGLVNVYRGTGKVLLSPLDDPNSLVSAAQVGTTRGNHQTR